eukprot:10407358-Alexandrium_andersonii.AAC.1
MPTCFRRSEPEVRGPGTALGLDPEAPNGCILRHSSRRFRIRQRERGSRGPAGYRIATSRP